MVEGEPDAVAACSLGLAAVGVPGARSWRASWAPRFTGLHLVIVSDCDEQGRALAEELARDLPAHAASVRVLDLAPGQADGYDLGDYAREAAEDGDAGRRWARRVIEGAAGSLAARKPTGPTVNGRGADTVDDGDDLRDLSLAEALARDLPPEHWIVEHLIAKGTIGVVHGLPETLKTFLALHIGIGVATGSEGEHDGELLLGKLRVTDPGPVGYAWQDDSAVEELRRIQTVVRATAVDPNLQMYFLLNRGLRIDRPGDRARLDTWIRRRRLKLVFLDSLKDFISTGSTKDDSWVTPTLNALKLICDETGVAFLMVHHDAKPSADTSSRSAGQTMHGSVFLEASARSGLHCQRPDAARPEVKVTRWGNSGKSWGPDLLRLNEETCELELVEIAHNAPKAVPSKYVQALREAGGEMFVSELAQLLGVSSKTALKHLGEAGAHIAPRKRGRTTANFAQLAGEQDALAI